MKREFINRFNIAGFTYYKGPDVFKKLKIGTTLNLKLEEDNKYDPCAVAIYYKTSKIGFIPRSTNSIFYKIIKVGLSKNIKVMVQQVDASANPEEQIYVSTYFVNKGN